MNQRGKEAPSGRHRAVVIEQLLQFCRAEFEKIEAEYPQATQSHYRLRDLLTTALSYILSDVNY